MFDHLADTNGAELYRFSQVYTFPDFVKQADITETMKPQNLPASVFADPRAGKMSFPCHTKASTWLSALYFAEKRAEYSAKDQARIQARLDHFVKYWDIKEAVDALVARWGELHKSADDKLPDSDFGYIWYDEKNLKHRSLRMKCAAEVLAAAQYLHTHRDALPFGQRNTIAEKVLEKAAAYGAGLGTLERFIEQQAGQGLCNPNEVVNLLVNRAKIASDGQIRAGFMKLAEQVAGKPSAALTPDMLVKLATTIDQLDGVTHLRGRYTEALPRPEDVIFRLTYKEAKAGVGDAVALTSGTVYDKTQFAKVSLDDLRGLFGSEFAAEVADGFNVDTEKLAELAATMPRDDAALFDRLMNEAGIPPIQVKAASARTGVGFDVLKHLGQFYQAQK